MRANADRVPLCWIAGTSTSVTVIAKRKAMHVQEIIKYLVCLAVFVLLSDAEPQEATANIGIRSSRRLFDVLLGRFRPCINCICGKSNRGGARFLGGEFTDTHEFPWLANIHVKNHLLVSGVLINDRYVLTAASQLIGATPPEVKVALGEYDRCHLDISSANISVDAVISHPEFSYESRAHDLALIRLSRSTQFERRVLPVCLPDTGSTYLGQVGTLMGWMESSDETNADARTCRPRKLGLPILGRRECLRSGIKPANYHEESGCVGVIGSSSIVCRNDVGSAVMHRSYSGYYDLVGILSDINNCNNTIGTAIYTQIGQHLEWIYQKTRDACYCIKPFDVPEIKSLIAMSFLAYFALGFLIPLANFHSLIKRSDVSYGSPDYKFCECGRKNGMTTPDDGRILGGKEASPNEYPWMALIVAVAVNSAFPQLICGGSLISDQYVLSAAHCLRPKYTQEQIKVVLGEHNYCQTDIRTVTFSVEAFIQHPEYVDSKHLFRDVMLIKLNMRVTFNAYIRPICLPNRVPRQSAEVRHGGKMGDILGWGVGDTLNESCALRKTSLFVYRPQNCPYKAFHLFCAGYLGEPRDSCVNLDVDNDLFRVLFFRKVYNITKLYKAYILKGDSGGPFQILNEENKYELIGILSSGVSCGDVDSPSLYTDVLYVLPWIYEVSRNSMFCWR